VSAPRTQALLWLLQRGSAGILAFCVAVHLVNMILAVRGGLSAAAILQRTQGSVAWAAFYALFVVAVAVHAPIGLRNVLVEWGWPRGRALSAALVALAALLLVVGMRAVYAVTAK